MKTFYVTFAHGNNSLGFGYVIAKAIGNKPTLFEIESWAHEITRQSKLSGTPAHNATILFWKEILDEPAHL